MVITLLHVLVSPARLAGRHARNLRLNRDRGPADRAGPCQCSGAAHPGRWSQKADAFKGVTTGVSRDWAQPGRLEQAVTVCGRRDVSQLGLPVFKP